MSLLDDVSIVVTPNGYKAGTLFGAIPVPTLGSEEVVNGDFATDTDWTKGTGWTISGGTANANTSGSYINFYQNNVFTIGKAYQYEFTILNYSQGEVRFTQGGVDISGLKSANGTYTGVFSASQTSLYIQGVNSFIGSIENVSVKEYTSADMDVTRATAATRVDEDGLIADVLSGVPRIDYTGGGCPHILAEPMRTNLYSYSNDTTTWSKSNFTATNNYAISPDGTQNAFRGVSTSNASLLYIGSTGSAGTNTISIYAKSNTDSDQKFRFFGNGNTTQSTDQTATQEWQRFEYTEAYSFITWGLLGASVSGTNDILFYGMQHEVGSYPTSYIPTDGGTVTRNQDILTRDGIGSLINDSEGVLFLEINYKNINSAWQGIALTNNNSANNRIFIGIAPNTKDLEVYFVSGGTTLWQPDFELSEINQFQKIAVKYKSNDLALWVNGVEVATSNSVSTMPVSLSALGFFGFGTSEPQYGEVRQLQVYTTALTDVQLAALTS